MQDLKSSKKKIVGLKQTVKSVKSGLIGKVYLAKDADDFIRNSILDVCKDRDVQIVYIETMKELGEACGIDIGASTAAILRD